MKFIVTLLLSVLVYTLQGQYTKTYLFVGTYTEGIADKGIYIYEFNTQTGKLKELATGQKLVNPSFLTLSSSGEYVYACTETKLPGKGSVSAFKFDSIEGDLTLLNTQKSGGDNPVYLTVSADNKYVVNANYTAGSVSVFKSKADGSLMPYQQLVKFQGKGPNHRRQESAHIHATVFSPDFAYLFFPDLGSDKIRVYRFDGQQNQVLEEMSTHDYTAEPGSGPRHMIFHPNARFAYCIEELSGTVAVFRYADGKLNNIQQIFAYSKPQEEYSGADIHISPDGLYLYASNRGENENTIAIFSIDGVSGRLNLVGHQDSYGKLPRNFTIDPTGHFVIVANQGTNNLVVFKRDLKSGLLTYTGEEVNVPRPSCLKMRGYGR